TGSWRVVAELLIPARGAGPDARRLAGPHAHARVVTRSSIAYHLKKEAGQSLAHKVRRPGHKDQSARPLVGPTPVPVPYKPLFPQSCRLEIYGRRQPVRRDRDPLVSHSRFDSCLKATRYPVLDLDEQCCWHEHVQGRRRFAQRSQSRVLDRWDETLT